MVTSSALPGIALPGAMLPGSVDNQPGSSTSTTFDDIAIEVEAMLRGYTVTQEQMASLAEDLPAAGFTFRIDDPTILTRGTFQVDDELVRLTGVANDGQSATVPKWGRGWQGSAITAHTAGAQVIKEPLFPRARIKRYINEGIDWCYPTLFAVKTDETNTVDITKYSYPLPSDVAEVISIEWRTADQYRYWVSMPRYRVDKNADRSQYPTGISVDIDGGMFPGQPIKITYRAKPAHLATNSDDFAGVTGLQDSSVHAIALYAASQMVVGLETARLTTTTVEQSDRAKLITNGSATNASKYLYALAQEALQTEQDRLFSLYPIQVQETW